MSNGHDKASFYQGIRAAISWLHAEARGMNDPHAKLVLNNAAFHLGQRKPDPALLPAAPDGATEGWRLVPVEPTMTMLQGALEASRASGVTDEDRPLRVGSELHGSGLVYRAMLAASPSVSPVGPKGEEAVTEEMLAAAMALGWPRKEVDRLTRTYRAMAALASSQPTQTGEENAGLAESLYDAFWTRNARGLVEPVPFSDQADAIKEMWRGIAADALASRSPIPGEGN